MTTPMTTPALVITQDLCSNVGPIGCAFFEQVLGHALSSVFITDESSLSDFSFSGDGGPVLAQMLKDPGTSLQAYYRAWDQWVLAKIEEDYGLKLPSTRVLLVTLFAQLEAQAESNKYLH